MSIPPSFLHVSVAWPPARVLVFSKEAQPSVLAIRSFKLRVALICVQTFQDIPKVFLDVSVPIPVRIILECGSCMCQGRQEPLPGLSYGKVRAQQGVGQQVLPVVLIGFLPDLRIHS